MPDYRSTHTGAQIDTAISSVLAGQAGLQGINVNGSAVEPDQNNKVSLNIPDVSQSLGQSTTSTMSQNAITSAVSSKANVTYYTATLYSNSWSGSTSNFTQSVNITGIVSTDKPVIDLTSPTTSTLDSWSFVSKADTYDGHITFTCFNYKPTVNLDITIMVVK